VDGICSKEGHDSSLHRNSCLLLICGEYSGLMGLIRLVCGVYLVGTRVWYAGSP
jgi:hypothetical protein